MAAKIRCKIWKSLVKFGFFCPHSELCPRSHLASPLHTLGYALCVKDKLTKFLALNNQILLLSLEVI